LDVIEVVSNHQFNLIRRSGGWEIIESAERKLLKDRIAKYFKENRALLKAIPDLILTMDRDGNCLESKIPNNISYLLDNQFIGKNIKEVFPKEVAESCLKLIKDTLQTMKIQTLEFQLKKDDKLRYFEARFIPFTEEAVLSLIRDISERKEIEKQIQASLKEKEMLLGEIHHRVKNNLQVISSLLNLKSGKIKGRESKLVLKECGNFVNAMVEIHENFYSSGNLARISLKEFILAVTKDLVRIYHPKKPDKVAIKFDLKDVALGIDLAIPLGLAFNELVTNSLKHAFPRGKKGEIRVSLHAREGNQIELVVGDNGIGLPKGLDIHKTKSFGFNLVTGLVEKQLQGKIKLSGTAGTEFRITLQEDKD
jgi:PAS domain S-box-containing protein